MIPNIGLIPNTAIVITASMANLKEFLKLRDHEAVFEAAKENEKVEVVFMDPPRAGSDINFLKSVVTLSPDKVVYISCNIETQARDLIYLCKNGYKVKKIQPVDMFPHTGHIESVVLLTKKGKQNA